MIIIPLEQQFLYAFPIALSVVCLLICLIAFVLLLNNYWSQGKTLRWYALGYFGYMILWTVIKMINEIYFQQEWTLRYASKLTSFLLIVMLLVLQIQILTLYGNLKTKINPKLIKLLYVLIFIFLCIAISPLTALDWYISPVNRPSWYTRWNSMTALAIGVFAGVLDNSISLYVLFNLKRHINNERTIKKRRGSDLEGVIEQDDKFRKTKRYLLLAMASDWIGIVLYLIRVIMTDPIMAEFFNEVSITFFVPHGLFLFAFYHDLTLLVFRDLLVSRSLSDSKKRKGGSTEQQNGVKEIKDTVIIRN